VRWSVAKGSPDGVSVSANGDVVVVTRDAGHVIIFSPTGQIVKEIKLPSTLVSPRHAIRLGGNELLLCHGWGESAYNISVVDGEGRIIKSASPSAAAPKSFSPTHLALDRYGNILVAEFKGDAIQMYNKDLQYLGDVVPGSSGLKRPFRLCYDNTSGRLYIGEYSTLGRMMIFNK